MKDNTAAVHVQVPVEVASVPAQRKAHRNRQNRTQAARPCSWCPTKSDGDAAPQAGTPQHDDPRLEKQSQLPVIAEKWKSAPRSRAARKEPTNKQTPVIKGRCLMPCARPRPEGAPPPRKAAPGATRPQLAARQPGTAAAPPLVGRSKVFRLVKSLFVWPRQPRPWCAHAPDPAPVSEPRCEGGGRNVATAANHRNGERNGTNWRTNAERTAVSPAKRSEQPW